VCSLFVLDDAVQGLSGEAVMDGDLARKLAELRGQIAELGSAIRQLRQAGMDSAAAQLLITRSVPNSNV
jgi:hypothetical protein